MCVPDPELGELVAEAHRIAGSEVPWRVHHADGERCVVFGYEADDALLSSRLQRGLAAFCKARSLQLRFAVARSTPVRWVRMDQPEIPDFPPD